jgi:hypothetical protein
VTFRFFGCTDPDRSLTKILGCLWCDDKGDTPVIAVCGVWDGLLRLNSIAKEDMLSLISIGMNPNLKFSLFAYDLLSLAHRDSGHLNPDISTNAIQPSNHINLGVTGTKR